MRADERQCWWTNFQLSSAHIMNFLRRRNIHEIFIKICTCSQESDHIKSPFVTDQHTSMALATGENVSTGTLSFEAWTDWAPTATDDCLSGTTQDVLLYLSYTLICKLLLYHFHSILVNCLKLALNASSNEWHWLSIIYQWEQGKSWKTWCKYHPIYFIRSLADCGCNCYSIGSS